MILPNIVLAKEEFIILVQMYGGKTSTREAYSSFGVLMCQILKAESLPSTFTATHLVGGLSRESNRIKKLATDCLNERPSKRPQASDVAQRLLDEYNDSCAIVRDPDIAGVLSRCRNLVHASRLQHSKDPDSKFRDSDVSVLLDHQDSWDDDKSSLRLAPKVAYLIGASILWGLIDVDIVPVPSA